MPDTISEFVAHWKTAALTERAGAQSHFIALCHALGELAPAEADPAGTWYTFERGLTKSSGGHGWADVWRRDCFAWEYKGQHKDLAAAYQQLQQYREALANPPLLIVSDMLTFEIHTNFTNTVKDIYRFDLDELRANQPTTACSRPPVDVLRACFSSPTTLHPQQTSARVTEAAAAKFAQLAESLHKRGTAPDVAAHFLMRLLFCLFAEDIGLLPPRLFTDLVEGTRMRPVAFAHRLRKLFGAMRVGDEYGNNTIRYFDGGLFDDDTVLDLTTGDLVVLDTACQLNWAGIEPAIFGTLFERSLDPTKRGQLGAHYTSRDDILLITKPVLMDPLYRGWVAVQSAAQELMDKREAAPDRATRNRHLATLTTLITHFADRLAAVRVLDPACGSGNFLYVALKQLLDLEKEVSLFAANSGLGQMLPRVSPEQLYGIELSPYAQALASVVVWIGYIQWFHDNGFNFRADPILRPLDNIQQMDAILAYDDQGRPVEPIWPDADVIIGNPPFLGGKKLRSELGTAYLHALFTLYEGRVSGEADLVCYWFENARGAVSNHTTKRVGLLATNSIRGGANRKVLERLKQSGDIFMAWSDRPWVLDGANVRVSIIGFDDGSEQTHILDGILVDEINPDLTGSLNITAAQPLRENAGICLRADEKGGPFEIRREIAEEMLKAPVNSNGRANGDVIYPWFTAMDMTRRPREMSIIDFGINMSEEEAEAYELPFSYIDKYVKPERATNNIPRLREKWWLHRVSGAPMRNRLSQLDRYIVTPVTAKYRLFGWLSSDVLPDITLSVFAREDDYFFGMLHSKPHNIWSLRIGSTLEDRPRYIPTVCFATFPFPWPPGQEPADDPRVVAIAAAARALVAWRDAWLNPPDATPTQRRLRTLTNLYNALQAGQVPELVGLHTTLDVAVLAAYGWPADLADDAVLAQLLALNAVRAAGSVDPTKETP